MLRSQAIQISGVDADNTLTPQQKRFNTLVKQIAQAKNTLQEWQENMVLHRQRYTEVMQPLHTKLNQQLRAWVLALDAALDQRGWTGSEQDLMAEMILQRTGELLEQNSDDAELHALFEKYNEIDFATEQQEELLMRKEMLEKMAGIDLGDATEIEDEHDLLQRLQQKMQEKDEKKAAAKAAKAEGKRKTAAQEKREAEEQQATQSVREIFRKLASALHPDREQDEEQRKIKTELMQRVNKAYAANDLLTLMEIQLEIEQVDVAHIANASADKIKHYIKVLNEQLQELKAEIDHIEFGFCESFGLRSYTRLKPSAVLATVDRNANLIQQDIRQFQQDCQMFSDKKATKNWLRQIKRAIKQADMDFF